MSAVRVCGLVFLLGLDASSQDWQLIWSDEFTGIAGSAPDQSKWTYDVGAGGWGNQELETYTDSTGNSFLDGNGNLVIRASRSESGGYTSARLKTQDRFAVAYGKIEARIKIPFGQGIWPAFWMLGADIATAGWPACGEIDIMENIGREPSILHGSLHGPGYSGGNAITASYTLPDGRAFSDDFHTFAVIWKPDNVRFLVDGAPYQTVTPSNLPAGAQWVFNKPFFMIVNVAVGGVWPGYPDASTQFPQQMTADYVRVYRSTVEPIVNPGGVLNAASFSTTMAPGSLAAIFGTGLADAPHENLFDVSRNAFPPSASGVTVSVNGAPAPLIYVSPGQINLQIPWNTPAGTPVDVKVTRNNVTSNVERVVFFPTAPSVFSASGAAILTCFGGVVKAGAACTLWGNGFGTKTTPQQDGVPASAAPLPRTTNTCGLTIGGIDADVPYCGAAPSLIIDQLNFVYPSGIPAETGTVPGVLSTGGRTEEIQLPRPLP